MSDQELLESMIDAAVDAGRAVQRIYQRGFTISTKADASPVTDADHESEAIILGWLARCSGATPVVAEEQVAAGGVPACGEEFFLVDPLDGTKEFIARRGEFTVNVALVRRGLPALGVVHAPASGQLFAGNVEARSAFRMLSSADGHGPASRESIHVRAVPRAGITAVASRSHPSRETEAYLARYAVAERISIGSSLKFCLVAEGKADLYPRLGTTMEWDTAAGHAVVLAAGGSVVAPDGQPLRYGKPHYRNSWFVASGTLVPQRIEG
ncbi:MAG TPA: 3'(2'),5'-bisphosphate nucleotidase CysQ [Steroidobacteraceae bacterium]|nr:3'(2'),5'-bisphosphate nucleotidase CysQ [Steroidobacteraceae bacterium]